MSNIDEVTSVVDAATKAHVTPVLISDPGMGKTAWLTEYASTRNLRLVILIGSSMDPTDVTGMPARVQDDDGEWITIHGTPEWAQFAKNDAEGKTKYDGTLIFWDELNTAPPAVQAVQLSILQSRRLPNGFLFPDTSYFVAAMNRTEDAADGWDLAAPLANRLLHLDWEPGRDEWFAGMADGFGADNITSDEAVNRSTIVAFLRNNVEFLDGKPDNSDDAGGAWPSRRTWDYLAKVTSQIGKVTDIDSSLFATLSTGLVGRSATARMVTWMNGYVLPDPEDVLKDPSSVDWGDQTSDKTYAIIGSVMAYGGSDRAEEVFEVFLMAAKEGRADAIASFVTPLMKMSSSVDRSTKSKMLTQLAKDLMPILKESGLSV